MYIFNAVLNLNVLTLLLFNCVKTQLLNVYSRIMNPTISHSLFTLFQSNYPPYEGAAGFYPNSGPPPPPGFSAYNVNQYDSEFKSEVLDNMVDALV